MKTKRDDGPNAVSPNVIDYIILFTCDMMAGAPVPTSTLLFTLLSKPTSRAGGITEYTSPTR